MPGWRPVSPGAQVPGSARYGRRSSRCTRCHRRPICAAQGLCRHISGTAACPGIVNEAPPKKCRVPPPPATLIQACGRAMSRRPSSWNIELLPWRAPDTRGGSPHDASDVNLDTVSAAHAAPGRLPALVATSTSEQHANDSAVKLAVTIRGLRLPLPRTIRLLQT